MLHPYRDLDKPGLRFVQTTIRSIDPSAKRVETDAGTFEADVMVVALGADLHPAATPGLVEVGYEFYTVDGAFALREVMSSFEGGRVIVGVTSTPFKCPPAPSETALLMHDYLWNGGSATSRTISLVMPLGCRSRPRPQLRTALLEAFDRAGIDWHPRAAGPRPRSRPEGRLLSDDDRDALRPVPRVPVHRLPRLSRSRECRSTGGSR